VFDNFELGVAVLQKYEYQLRKISMHAILLQPCYHLIDYVLLLMVHQGGGDVLVYLHHEVLDQCVPLLSHGTTSSLVLLLGFNSS
jgi:hypothetical protein